MGTGDSAPTRPVLAGWGPGGSLAPLTPTEAEGGVPPKTPGSSGRPCWPPAPHPTDLLSHVSDISFSEEVDGWEVLHEKKP